MCGRSGTTEENRVVLFTRRPPPCRKWREALGRSNCMPEVAGSIPFARLGFFRYETGALSHQFEAESTVRFSILI